MFFKRILIIEGEYFKMKKTNTRYVLNTVLAVVLFVITYKYVLNTVSYDGINDYVEHMWIARDIYMDKLWEAWVQRPYLFWHLCVKACIKFLDVPVLESCAFVSALLAGVNYFITYYIVDKLAEKKLERNVSNAASGVAFALGIAMPFYFYWINPNQYLGQFSINPVFNPTHMASKPFGLLAFMFALDIIYRFKGQECVFGTSKIYKKFLYVWFSIALLFSTFAKPTFMYMLLPAGGIYILTGLIKGLIKKESNWKNYLNLIWKLLLASLPSLLYLALEYAAFYFWGGTNADAKIVLSPFLYVWENFTNSVPKSILMSMTFPIWMVITNPKYFFKSVEGQIGMLAYAVGTLEFAFFMETGEKALHANFAWPMMAGMLLLWVIASVRLVELTGREESGKLRSAAIYIGWILLLLQLFSGTYYINPYQYII